jgi:23S rRNA (uracil1939-C5)-methyltransferase
MVPGGDGFARLGDGRVGFASGALPGDVIHPIEIDDRRSYVRALTWELVESGPERVSAPCPVADTCGGCDWMHLSREAQLRAKAGVLREALSRTGGFRELPESLPVVSAGPDLHYRGRLRVHVDDAGRIGLFARRSHQLIEVPGCPVSLPAVEQALPALREAAARHPGALSALSAIEIRTAPSGPPLALELVPRDGHQTLPASTAAFRDELAEKFAVGVEREPQARHAPEPGDEQRWPLPGGVELSAPLEAFTQVNWSVNNEMVRAVLDGARERNLASFCDLYCGAGNFALPLLSAGLTGIGIDREQAGIEAARRSARSAGLPDSGFLPGDVAHRVRSLVRKRRRFDLVLLDPPRSGARDVLPAVADLAPRYVAVCSCDPVTLARDLRALARSGYELESVTGFDMFPHTHHVEALAWMRRKAEGGEHAISAWEREPRSNR